METIPEEDHEKLSANGSQQCLSVGSGSGQSTRTVETKNRFKEVYTSEQVDTLVTTVPESAVPSSWKLGVEEEVVVDPAMASSYITEPIAGPASARGSTYTYTYESHYEDPVITDLSPRSECVDYPEDSIERHSHQTRKVTRVTKVTTTRSVRQVPLNSDEIYFDKDGNPIPLSEYTNFDGHLEDRELGDLGIDLSKTSIQEREEVTSPVRELYPPRATPSSPGVPQVIDLDLSEVTLMWMTPDHHGSAGSIIGYMIELRNGEDEPWRPAHDGLIQDPQCKITNLDPGAEYEFRVLAANRAGLGLPSNSCPPVQLRSRNEPAAGDSSYGAPVPGKPSVVGVEGDRAIIEWSPSPFNPDLAPVAGYIIEYRSAGTTSWIQSNDFVVTSCQYEVSNLRPNGEYEFRVLARSADGVSRPSPSSGFYRMRPAVAVRNAHSHNHTLVPPGQPNAVDIDVDWVLLEWPDSPSASHMPVSYSVEFRELGDPTWYSAVSYPVTDSHLKVMHLRANSTYEFRVFTMSSDGGCSLPSDCSDVVQLRAKMKPHAHRNVPARPNPPEYLDFDGGSSVTLCWMPANSTLPVLGYEVEFRDFQQDPTQWYKVTNQLIQSCKTIVGCLLQGHQYQFRIVAKNAVGYSEPSDPSSTITIGTSTYGQPKFVEAERYGTVTLVDEMIRESPPIPDRDDSPPPFNTKNTNMQWRDPTLKEVIDYLRSPDKDLVINASGYLQHLTFNDNNVKEDTREYGGIDNLIKLLRSDVPEIQRNACGCLKNLAFGKENDLNKKEINDKGGVAALADLLRSTQDLAVKEEATRVLWNMSSCDDVKKPILQQTSDIIIAHVVVPSSGLVRRNPSEPSKVYRNLFGPGTGVLRNISAESITARQMLRHAPGLIEALQHFLKEAIPRENLIDAQEVENVVCILRNLSYRVQEVVDPDYNPNREAERRHNRERSKSAPSGSPKTKKKGLFKRKGKDRDSSLALQSFGNPDSGAALLWHTDTVKLYLKLLQDSSNSDTLEASAAAIQNLAACSFEPSAQVRSAVRTEKGLSVLVDLLRLKDDRVVCVVATALRNLSLDEKNRVLIGKYAMKDLVSKLPRPDEQARNPGVSDATITAVLGILFEVVRSSADFTKALHEANGTERLRKLAASSPTYSIRVCKYASQVLYVMWQHKELHDGFKRANLKEADFYSGPAHSRHSNTTTLARPISSQGPERPARLRSETLDETLNSDGAPVSGRYGAMGSTQSVGRNSARYGEYNSSTPNSDRSGSQHQHMYSPSQQYYANYSRTGPRQVNPYDQIPAEPVYASVKKHNGNHRTSTVGDSWV